MRHVMMVVMVVDDNDAMVMPARPRLGRRGHGDGGSGDNHGQKRRFQSIRNHVKPPKGVTA
jgi:hypothetical protein